MDWTGVWLCSSKEYSNVKYWCWSDLDWTGVWLCSSKEYSNVAPSPQAVGFPVGMVIPM